MTDTAQLQPSETEASGEEIEQDPGTTFRALLLASLCLSTWMLSLFVGVTLGGAIHLLLLVVLWLRPWRISAASGEVS